MEVTTSDSVIYISYSDLSSLNGFTETVKNKPGGQRATYLWKNEQCRQ